MVNNDEIDDDSLYWVYLWWEIIVLLISMMEKNQLLSLLIKGGFEFVIIFILEVDVDDDLFIIDVVFSVMFNESIVVSKCIGFEVLYNSICIIFNVDGVWQVEYQNCLVLKVGILESLVCLQCCEYFCILILIVKFLCCIFCIM